MKRLTQQQRCMNLLWFCLLLQNDMSIVPFDHLYVVSMDDAGSQRSMSIYLSKNKIKYKLSKKIFLICIYIFFDAACCPWTKGHV